MVVELEQGQVNMDALTKSQNLSSQLPHAMAGYISWLGPQMLQIPSLLRETFEGARAKATSNGNHLRIPEALAHLWLGLHCGLTYATDIGACSADEAENLRESCWDALLRLGGNQGQLVEEERPSRRFLRVLATLVIQGRVALLPKNESGNYPQDGTNFIGWQDDEMLYLQPEAAFKAVSRFCQETAEPLAIRQNRLNRELAVENISEYDPGRTTAATWIDDRTRRVLKLKIAMIEEVLGEEFPRNLTTYYRSYRSGEVERDGI